MPYGPHPSDPRPPRESRTKPVRITVDLTPTDYQILNRWLARASVELDQPVSKMTLARAIRAMIQAAAADHVVNDVVLDLLRRDAVLKIGPGSARHSRGPMAFHTAMRVHIAAAMIVFAVAAVIGCAGCSARPAHSQPSPARSLPSPGCSTSTAPPSTLSGVRTAMVKVPGTPFGVVVTPDGRWAFVALISSVEVLRLGPALTRGFGPANFVGAIPLGLAPVGMAVSPDGRWLYATSEVAGRNARGQGSLTVISLPRAETDPAASVVTTVAAGCSPVRVITSADGREVWVTARESDDLLCFDAAALRSDPARALVAVVRVGEAPVGLMLVRDGSRVVVADSNRFNATGANSDLSVVNVAAALAGRPAVTGRIPAGQFPREMALVPGGQRLLVSNFASGQVEAVSVPTIPAAGSR